MAGETPAWVFFVPLFVGLIALIGVVITLRTQNKNFKKQIRSAHALKLAEMRQDWIHRLREAMATFQSYGVTPDLEHDKKREFYESGTLIELYMNRDDPDFLELRDCLNEFLSAENNLEKWAANPDFVIRCQIILKREWDVLKAELKTAAE